MIINKSLAEILLINNIYTSDKINELIELSIQQKITLHDYLVEVLKTDENILAALYAKELNFLFITSIDESNVDVDLLSRISLKFLRDNTIIPIKKDQKIIILTANPFSENSLDELSMALGSSKIAIATKSFIVESVNRYYPLEGGKKVIEELEAEGDISPVIDFNSITEEDVLSGAQDAPIIKLVNNILFQAVKRGASDIHIEPFEKELRIRYRIDGNLYIVMNPPKRVQAALSSRLKIMSNLNIAEKRQPQDGRIQVKISAKPIDIRVSILPVVYGERIVMRLLDKSKSFIPIEDLGMSNRDLLVIKDSIIEPNGIILVTGPTGSGKTSTLYAILNRLNTQDGCIITVEDPVEYQMSGVGQVQVREKIGLTFAASLRSILRQDPDIVMIGETRDQETAQIAIQAALTGHLVLSTLHTNSACASITRLIDMGIEPFLIASSLSLVIAQRLVRKLCEYCKEVYTPSEEEVRRLPGGSKLLAGAIIYRPKGCPNCLSTGYRGRMPIFEVMKMNTNIGKLTLERATASVLEEQAKKDGMTLLIDDGIRKVREGRTSIEEVLTVASSYEVETNDPEIIELNSKK